MKTSTHIYPTAEDTWRVIDTDEPDRWWMVLEGEDIGRVRVHVYGPPDLLRTVFGQALNALDEAAKAAV